MKRVIAIAVLIMVVCVMVAACGSKKDAPQDPSITSDTGKNFQDTENNESNTNNYYEMNKEYDIDLNDDGQLEKFSIDADTMDELYEIYFVLNGEKLTIPFLTSDLTYEKYRIIDTEESGKLFLLYEASPPDGNNVVLFKYMDESLVPFGYINDMVNFFEMGIPEVIDMEVCYMDTKYEIDQFNQDAYILMGPKDKYLDYLGLPKYSIKSELGEPDYEGDVQDGYILAYHNIDLVLYIENGNIAAIQTSNGSLLDIEIGKYLEQQQKWNDLIEGERYFIREGKQLSPEYENHCLYKGEYYIEVLVDELQEKSYVRQITIYQSEINRAIVREEHVLLDRFGNLMFVEELNKVKILIDNSEYENIEIINYERELGKIVLTAIKENNKGLYIYDVEAKQLITVAQEIVSVIVENGRIVAKMESGEEEYDFGGKSILEEANEFYVLTVNEDRLYYLDWNKNTAMLEPFSDYLLDPNYSEVLATYNKELGTGILELQYSREDNSFWLYTFLPEEILLKSIYPNCLDYQILTKDQARYIIVEQADTKEIHLFDVYGVDYGICDDKGNLQH